MKIAICDDEIEFQSRIQTEIEQFYGVLDVEIEGFLSGNQFLKRFKYTQEEYQLILMDIEMDGIDGIETARQIREVNKNVAIIFLTSHNEMAVEGYEVNAFRFLTKPLDQKKLWEALQAIEKSKESQYKIEVWDGEKTHFISCCEIQYIQSENIYINIVTSRGKYLIRKKLSLVEEELPKQLFYRLHRSYLVNLRYIHSYDGKKVVLENGKEIPISRNKRCEFKTVMMKYLQTLG
ncbi:MAG: LytR/AlgR family response regulator transcription factor [Cellulosilyticaceae bacterium]